MPGIIVGARVLKWAVHGPFEKLKSMDPQGELFTFLFGLAPQRYVVFLILLVATQRCKELFSLLLGDLHETPG